MGIEENLQKIGKVIALILALIVLVQILFVINRDCKNFNVSDSNFSIDTCVTNLIFIIIPTEVSIVEILSPFPIILLIILLLYWRYVSPHKK